MGEIHFDDHSATYPNLTTNVPRILDLDEEDGGLGTVVNATGKGYKNGTSLIVFVDKPVDHDDNPKTDMVPNRLLDLGEDVLCAVDSIGGDDTGTCEFTVTHPTFTGGINYINAVDGRNGYISPDQDLSEFDLTASVTASPAGGSPGEIMQIQVVDFPQGAVGPLKLSRTITVCTWLAALQTVAAAPISRSPFPTMSSLGYRTCR